MIKKPRTIIAIGGGDMRRGSTREIDQHIVSCVSKPDPNFLFIPTASSDAQGYCDIMQQLYGELGCHTDVLYVIKEQPSKDEIKAKIAQADIIYVGGGNTLMMMKLWRKLGIDTYLKDAWEKGTILCGMSAGSICWFESGHSDSRSFKNPDSWKYINVRGLGLLPGIHCPHYDSDTLGVPRRKYFHEMMLKRGGQGVAIDDNCALVFHDTEPEKVLRSSMDANAYKVFKQNGIIREEQY